MKPLSDKQIEDALYSTMHDIRHTSLPGHSEQNLPSMIYVEAEWANTLVKTGREEEVIAYLVKRYVGFSVGAAEKRLFQQGMAKIAEAYGLKNQFDEALRAAQNSELKI